MKLDRKNYRFFCHYFSVNVIFIKNKYLMYIDKCICVNFVDVFYCYIIHISFFLLFIFVCSFFFQILFLFIAFHSTSIFLFQGASANLTDFLLSQHNINAPPDGILNMVYELELVHILGIDELKQTMTALVYVNEVGSEKLCLSTCAI